MPDAEILEDELSTVAVALDSRRGSLIVRQTTALAQFPEYSNVPREDLERSCDRNVARVVALLRGHQQLPSDVVEDERLSGERRARQGIPAEVVVAAYRAVIAAILDDYLQVARDVGVSVDAMLLGVRRLWALTDHMSSTLVAARHKVELDRAREAEQDRMLLLHRALDGSASPAELLDSQAGSGFSDTADYWVLRGDVETGRAGEISRRLESTGRTSTFSPMIARYGSTIVGIVGRALTDFDPAVGTVASIGPVRLGAIPAAADEATSVLHVARLFDRRGIVDRDTLSLLMTVVEQEQVGERLRLRYVEPVRRGSAMADDILDSIRAFLACQRSVQITAAALSIHVNTLRYRIEKFEELTGCDTAQTEVLIDVWWALQYERAQH